MAPFEVPVVIAHGIKEKIDALHVEGDKLYVGTSTGTLQVYELDSEERNHATLVTTKSLSRKAIEQIGYIKDINSLVVLVDSTVTLYPLPSLVPPTPLSKTRNVFSFAVHSAAEHVIPTSISQQLETPNLRSLDASGVPTMVTHLVVGCQRKLVVYGWRDGDAQEVKEVSLPHSARKISFINPRVLSMAYPSAHVMFFLDTMTSSEVTLPIPSSTSAGVGVAALSGLGGYMTLGLGAKAKPLMTELGSEEVLIPKDNHGFFIGPDGNPSRNGTVEWPAPPEDLAYVRPYICTTMPVGAVSDPSSSSSQPATFPSPVLQMRSSLSLSVVQNIPLPFVSVATPNANNSVKLLTASPNYKSPLFVVTTPVERTAAASEGSTVWSIKMKPWSEQIDELVESESYTNALALLDIIDGSTLKDKEVRRKKIQGLEAVSKFKNGKYDAATETFIELDMNPAKVVALYPPSISGRLFIPSEEWIPLFGGPKKREAVERVSDADPASTESIQSNDRTSTPTPSVRDAPVVGHDKKDKLKRSVETLIKYLSDRRPKVKGALEAVRITPSQSHQFPFLSETSVEDLMSLPNLPLTALSPEQLTRFAQIVDTALFKSYLAVRPALLGPLCRVENWCEVSEVEEVLQEREKYSELIFLYNGKRMHDKALSLLRRLSEKQSDMEDKLRPTITYLQNLNPEYLDQIFEAARWAFAQNAEMAFEIFTSEQTELPRSAVADFLEDVDPKICAKYIEYLIAERDETSMIFHDRLAELYLDLATVAKKKSVGDYQEAYKKLMEFVENTHIYRVDRLFGLLPRDYMFEARAVILGRLGRHENALETYVYRLHDYLKAEEYCKQIYQPESPMKDVFLTLLKIYLQPTQGDPSLYLKPALELISRQSPRLDTVQTLELLPPLITTQEIKAFLYDSLRQPVFDMKVIREIGKARKDQVSGRLVALESRRVKVTDSRICPQCHKRLGNSVIAVHAPGGEVTHYQCREAFAKHKHP